jgi:uncharacterized protein (TIGR03382 family)
LHVKKLALFGLLAVAGAAMSANAFEFRVRFAERVAGVDTALMNNTIDATDGAAHQIAVQFGVFDDAGGAAPAGGYLGWNVGSLTVTGGAANSDETRTPGRLPGFDFAQGPNSNGNPPLPGGDPFESLTEIDNTQGTQTVLWFPGQPMPSALTQGLNGWVSTFVFTIDPAAGATSYDVNLAGNVLAATGWNVIQSTPPGAGPGFVLFGPVAGPPTQISGTLHVDIIPAPGAAALLGLGGLVAIRRRR